MCNLDAPHFKDETKARQYLEAIRWPGGPVCPHCGAYGNHYALHGKAHRPGLWKCKDCRKQFSVTVGTVFERSKIPLTKWLMAAFLICSSKKGISAHQLHRTLGVTYKTAWFLAHRIRHAMETPAGVFGQGGGIVEADETYIGKKAGAKVKTGWGHKQKVFALVERGGKARSFKVSGSMFDAVKDAMINHVATDAHVMTDEARMYPNLCKRFATHNTVNHSDGEYGRGIVHTNTIEGYFSVFKRGMKGVYQHCDENHLHRYLAEFDFRYNHRIALGVDDVQRTTAALAAIAGKRLTYKGPN